jgi:hypothetical protein
MLGEIEIYGTVLNIEEVFSGLGKGKNLNPANINQRSPTWLDLRLKRVIAKEFMLQANNIKKTRATTEAEVCMVQTVLQ